MPRKNFRQTYYTEEPDLSQSFRCRHVFTDGRRCAAACLRHEPFCYYHHTTRRPVQNLPARRRRSATFTLPELEDRASVQLALAEVLQRIASNDIDPKRAGHLLFGLQIATMLLPKHDPKDKTQPKTVSEITHDEELGDLAPIAQVGHDRQPEPWQLVIADILKASKSKHQEPKPTQEALVEEEPEATLPTLQAVAEAARLPTPDSLFPIPYSLFPIPYSLLPIPSCNNRINRRAGSATHASVAAATHPYTRSSLRAENNVSVPAFASSDPRNSNFASTSGSSRSAPTSSDHRRASSGSRSNLAPSAAAAGANTR